MKQKYFFIVITIALGFIPVGLWMFMESLGTRFQNYSSTLQSIGQVSALLGTVFFAVGVIVQTHGKISRQEEREWFREKFETVTLLLLLMHPIVLVATVVLAGKQTFLVSLQGAPTWTVSFGVYALLLCLAYYSIRACAGKGVYLRATPHVLSAILFLGTLHAFFIPSDLSRSPLLQGYVLTVVAVAFACYAYQIFVKRFGVALVGVKENESTNSAL